MINVGIIGIGLIGGSLGLALRRTKGYQVLGWSRSKKSLLRAKRNNVVHVASSSLLQVVSQSDIVVYCVPVHKMKELFQKTRPYLKPGTLLTDVGSVKQELIKQAKQIFKNKKGVEFVGGHPIAGSEKSGNQYASKNLFKGAPCVITTDGASKKAQAVIKAMWRHTGAVVLSQTAREHDDVLALTSHLPHLIAFSLFDNYRRKFKRGSTKEKAVGKSFFDVTRIAASDASIWSGIVSLNRNSIQKSIRSFSSTLNRLSRQSPSHLNHSLMLVAREKNKRT